MVSQEFLYAAETPAAVSRTTIPNSKGQLERPIAIPAATRNFIP